MPTPPLIAIMVVAPLATAVIAAVCAAAASGRIARNQLVGFRTPTTLASTAAWRAAHRAGLVPAVFATVLLAAIDLAILLVRPAASADGWLAAVLLVLLLAAVVVTSVVAVRAAHRR